MKHVAALAGLISLFIAFVDAQKPVGATIDTSSGAVTGHAARNRTQVSEYLGIPYAQPPLGSLRFAEPQTFSSPSPLDASSYVRLCPN